MKIKTSPLIDDIIRACSQCGRCEEECVFLKEFKIDPKKFAGKLRKEGLDDLNVIYSCNLCGVCKDICPEKLDLGRLFLWLREEVTEEGKELPPAHEWLKERRDWINGGGFLLAQGNNATEGKCERVFFPGCSLAGYNPHLVLETYTYLGDHNRSTGIILNCCGSPSQAIGDKNDFTTFLHTIQWQMEKLGSSHIVTACPSCYRVFKEYLPHYELSSLYEVMANEGLPEIEGTTEHQFFLFHPCSTRHAKEVQDSVCSLIEKAGYHRLHEMTFPEGENKCCGMGGLVGLNNPYLAVIIAQERTDVLSHDIVTYCAACRDALVLYRPTLHFLDLIFNPNWEQDKENPPLEYGRVRENLTWLKSKLEKDQR